MREPNAIDDHSKLVFYKAILDYQPRHRGVAEGKMKMDCGVSLGAEKAFLYCTYICNLQDTYLLIKMPQQVNSMGNKSN